MNYFHVLLEVVGILLVTGVLLWGLESFPAIDGTIKQMIKVVVIVIAALALIALFFPVGHSLR